MWLASRVFWHNHFLSGTVTDANITRQPQGARIIPKSQGRIAAIIIAGLLNYLGL